MRILTNRENVVVLTLQERCTTANPEFIIKFYNEITRESKVIAVTDESDYTERYNLFRITETTDQDFVHSHVSLSPTGSWTYTAYEMAESSPRNLDPDDALSEVETGICEVVDPGDSQVNHFEEDETNGSVFDED